MARYLLGGPWKAAALRIDVAKASRCDRSRSGVTKSDCDSSSPPAAMGVANAGTTWLPWGVWGVVGGCRSGGWPLTGVDV